jgi:homoserine dehydrogenase
VATILSSEGINIEALMQKAQDSTQEGETTCVPIVLLTRAADEAAIDRAIAALEALPAVRGAVLRLRVEPFAAS